MARLTDTLGGTSFQPRTISQGPSGPSFLQGAADLGKDLVGLAGQRSRASATKQNDAAADEYALGVFQTLTGIDLTADPETQRTISEAQRLTKARDKGTISKTVYDIRMENMTAELLRKNPENAAEYMAQAYTMGVDNYLFREAYEQKQLGQQSLDNMIKQRETALQAATNAGIYWSDEESGVIAGMNVLQKQEEQRMIKERLDIALKEMEMNGKINEPLIKEARRALVTSSIDMVAIQATSGFNQLYDLQQMIDGTPERAEAFDQALATARAQINQLSLNAERFMRQPQGTITGADGREISLNYQEEDIVALRNSINYYKGMFDELAEMDPERRARWLARMKEENEISMYENVPSVMALAEQLGGLGVVVDMMTLPEKYNLPPELITEWRESFNKGFSAYTAEVRNRITPQYIHDETMNGRNPSLSSNPEVRKKAFPQNAALLKSSQTLLREATYKPEEKEKVLENYKNYNIDVINALSAYTPNSIRPENVTKAIDVAFNTDWITGVLTYQTQGGSPDVASQLLRQGGISATTFLEGFVNDFNNQGGNFSDLQIEYNRQLQRYVPIEAPLVSRSDPETGLPIAYSGTMIPKRSREAAAQANKLLAFINEVSKHEELIPANVLKGAGEEGEVLTLSDVVASRQGLDGAVANYESNAARAQQQSADQLFRSAADNFGINTNPFMSMGASSGQQFSGSMLSPSVPKEFQPFITSAVEEFGGDTGFANVFTRLLKAESNFNPTAEGRHIEGQGTAKGMGQFMDATFEEVKNALGDPSMDVNNPEDNIRASAYYLKQMYDRYGGDPIRALMAYNWGPGRVDNWTPGKKAPKETMDYVVKIMMALDTSKFDDAQIESLFRSVTGG